MTKSKVSIYDHVQYIKTCKKVCENFPKGGTYSYTELQEFQACHNVLETLNVRMMAKLTPSQKFEVGRAKSIILNYMNRNIFALTYREQEDLRTALTALKNLREYKMSFRFAQPFYNFEH